MIPTTLYHWLKNLRRWDQPLTKLEKKKDEFSIMTIFFRKRDTAPFYRLRRRVILFYLQTKSDPACSEILIWGCKHDYMFPACSRNSSVLKKNVYTLNACMSSVI